MIWELWYQTSNTKVKSANICWKYLKIHCKFSENHIQVSGVWSPARGSASGLAALGTRPRPGRRRLLAVRSGELSEFCQNFVRILSKFCQNFVKISSAFCQNFVKFQQNFHNFLHPIHHFSAFFKIYKFL